MNRDEICKIFRDPPKMVTERLILRKMKRSDSHDMYEYAKNPIVTKFLLWDPHPDELYTERYLEYINSLYRDGDFYDWAVTLKNSKKMIGTCGFTKFDFQNNCAEIGYVINPDFWGQGIAPEAIRSVMRFGFISLNLHRIEARYIYGNEQSRKVMEKCGMTFEGYKRSSLFVKGEYKTIGSCAIISDEFIAKYI